MDREKGVASRPCPTCDRDLLATQQLDGAIAYETCPTCFGEDQAPEPVQAAQADTDRQTSRRAPRPAAEDHQAAVERSTGTDVTQEHQ